MKNNKNILITGGSGFIGKNLNEYLKNIYKVFAPSHSSLELLDEKKVRYYILKNKIDVIIHSAIIGGGKEDIGLKDVVRDNLQMFFNISRNDDLVDKIIYFGTGLEYDKNRPLISVKEEDFNKKIPVDDYGFYKYVSAKYTDFSKNIYDLIIFGIYGKYEDYIYRFISNSILKNLLHLPIVIMQNTYFDYLYIEDLYPIIDYFIVHKPKYHRYNTTSGKKVDLVTIAKIINEVSDYKSEILIMKKGVNNEYTANNSRLKEEFKNLKLTFHKEAIKKLY